MVESGNFYRLRREVLRRQKEELDERRMSNPVLSASEQLIGCFVEEIEPQVRGAITELNQKGYATFSSGFYDFDPRFQTIEGTFTIDHNVQTVLSARGVEVISGPIEEFCDGTEKSGIPITIIQFQAESPDLRHIEDKWKEVVTLIPDNSK